MADMKKVYEDLIIINVYWKCIACEDWSKKLLPNQSTDLINAITNW